MEFPFYSTIYGFCKGVVTRQYKGRGLQGLNLLPSRRLRRLDAPLVLWSWVTGYSEDCCKRSWFYLGTFITNVSPSYLGDIYHIAEVGSVGTDTLSYLGAPCTIETSVYSGVNIIVYTTCLLASTVYSVTCAHSKKWIVTLTKILVVWDASHFPLWQRYMVYIYSTAIILFGYAHLCIHTHLFHARTTTSCTL